jgi:predicted AlkP superfamily pyrophosphatase or phosphodiesterase
MFGRFPRANALLLIVALASRTSAQGSGTGGVNSARARSSPYVVMLSLDGFRAEYLRRLDLPNVERLERDGARSEGMRPVFPSLTFPNHLAIVTGMYAEHHGIVGNSFWDPARNAKYSLSDSLSVRDGTWYRGEPIWVTAEKQGMVAASFFWPGSEAAIEGVRPTFSKAYSTRVPNRDRADTVLSWLRLPAANRPHMITMYMSDVDHAGHENGPLSAQVDTAAWLVDAALGRLLGGIDSLPTDVRQHLYLVLVADHGMTETSPRWFASLDTLIDLAGVQIPEAGAVAMLHVAGGAARAAVLRDSINRRMRHGRAYLRRDVPARLHFRNDPRIGDVVVIMDEHFTVGTRPPRGDGGNHGYDPALPSMAATFVVRGPGIPAGRTIPAFDNIEIYPWLASVLGLRANPNTDGHPGALSGLLRGAR